MINEYDLEDMKPAAMMSPVAWPMSGAGPARFEAVKSNPHDYHSPWLLRMPGTTACLLFNHESDDRIDEARCKIMAAVCNSAIPANIGIAE